ncbi:MAG: glycosyltransferase [Candidatus Hydrogenedentes bacterium]|nr:glycosyltransferase [Candidatus Hydrogenedentota bacterium]
MKTAHEWSATLSQHKARPGVELLTGRGGEPTLRVDEVLLHSQYKPREEAARLVDSAELEPGRPVLVVGVGLGYHVAELLHRGFDVSAVEPDLSVATFAIQNSLRDSSLLIGIGDTNAIGHSSAFRAIAAARPQVFVHPPTARLHPHYVDAVQSQLARARIADRRLGVAVVGPMYGGSLPNAQYLARAFQRMGHRTLFVDNSAGWPLYEAFAGSVASKRASSQLSGMVANMMSEWSYARVSEFAPNVCIVLAQAPVGNQWPLRLRKENIVTAYWFVENWRHMTYWSEIAPHYDCFFHIQPGEFEDKLTQAGCRRHAYVQTACDPEVHCPVALTAEERATYGCHVSFAGAGYRNRNMLFSGLTDYDFKIWGVEWSARELQRLVCKPDHRFTPEDFSKIVAGSAINLNLHSSATHDGVDPRCDAINPRVFEIAACGGFQLCDPCVGLDALFDFEKELPVYRTLAELRGKIDYYLAHEDERLAIALAARQRVLREHTYEHRAQQMLDTILEHFADRIESKGIRAQRSVAEVADSVGRETPLGRYLSALPSDTPFTQEAINARVPLMGTALSYPEAVFAYLRELRSSAEQLLAEFADD